MRFFISILLLLPIRLLSAVGDITGACIETNGWVLDIWVSGYTTNSTYNFGWSNPSNIVTGTEKLKLTVISPGWSDTGTSNIITRKLYGGRQLRFAYGIGGQTANNFVQDVQIDAGHGNDAVLRVSLSEYVFTEDISATMTLLSGFYSNNAAASFAVTNLSLVNSWNPVANWSPGFFGGRVFVTTPDLRVIGGHWSAIYQGRPLSSVTFVVSDTSGHSITNTQTTPRIDRAYADAVPVIEYISAFSTADWSTISDGNFLKCDFIARGRVGTNVLSTFDGLNALPPEYASQSNMCNRLGAYGGACVVLDATNGSDSTGRAYLRGASPALPVKTLSQALTVVKATNNAFYSHNDCGGATIYVTNGLIDWSGNLAFTCGSTPIACEITRHPDTPRSSAVFNSGRTTADGNFIWRDLILQNDEAYGNWGSSTTFFESCVFTNIVPSDFAYNDNHQLGFSKCIISSGDTWNFQPRSTCNTPFFYVRGCTINRNMAYKPSYLFVGNNCPGPNTGCLINQFYSTVPTTPAAHMPILMFNTWYKNQSTSAGLIQFEWSSNNFGGCLIAQNLVEVTNVDGFRTMYLFADDSSDSAPSVKNLLLWNNTFLGEGRINYCYNWGGTTFALREGCQLVGNYLEGYAIKSDTYSVENGARTGNWSPYWGCLHLGNYNNAVGSAGIISAWDGDYNFGGLSWGSKIYSGTNYPQFVARSACDGTNTMTGGGNYMITSHSPLLQLTPNACVLPYDIQGNERGGFDPPGAYSSASPRKGGFFF